MEKSQFDILKNIEDSEYKYGFTTQVENDTVPVGISEDIIRLISKKKNEPEFMLEFRLNAYRKWRELEEPDWAFLKFEKVDYNALCYYSAPKKVNDLKSLDDVDPEILETYKKLWIPHEKQKMLQGVAVDAVFDSVSIATTYKKQLNDVGIIFCSISEAVRDYPELIKKYLASVVSVSDNFFSVLNSAVFSDATFVYVQEAVR